MLSFMILGMTVTLLAFFGIHVAEGYTPAIRQAVIVLTFSYFALPGLFKAVFGRELLIGATRCEIAAESVPDSKSARIITLSPTKIRGAFSFNARVGLRHGIYDHPECVREMRRWLRQRKVS